MQYVLTPYAQELPPYAWWDGAFTNQELDWLQQKSKAASKNAEIGTGPYNGLDTESRRSQVDWLNNTPNTEWVFKKLAHVAMKLNAEHFRFDLTGFGEPLQLTNYNQNERGMYGWHQDYGTDISRKLSLVVQLAHPSEYEGGDLQIITSSTPTSIKKQRGLIVAFPSYVVHQVTPVTQGSRQSLVAWVSGPAFK